MYKIDLVHKYESPLFAGDYSNGTFVEGLIQVKTQEEVDKIKTLFLSTGEIELYENTYKYNGNIPAKEKTLVNIFNIENESCVQKNHRFGEGYLILNKHYTYYYWLEIKKLPDRIIQSYSVYNGQISLPKGFRILNYGVNHFNGTSFWAVINKYETEHENINHIILNTFDEYSIELMKDYTYITTLCTSEGEFHIFNDIAIQQNLK